MLYLRRLQLADARDLAAVESAAWRKAYASILPASHLRELSPDSLEIRWRRRLQRGEPLSIGAALGAHIVGYATAGPCRDRDFDPGFAGELFELYIHPAVQGRGLGRDLLDAAAGLLGARGHRWGVLWVLEANRGARLFYERQGLLADGQRRRLLVAGHAITAVRYAWPLNPVDPLALCRGENPATPG